MYQGIRQNTYRRLTTAFRQAEAASKQRYGKASEPAPHPRAKEVVVKEREQRDSEENRIQQGLNEQSPSIAAKDDEPASKPPRLRRINDTSTPLPPPLPPPPSPSVTPNSNDAKPPDGVLHIHNPQEAEAYKPPHLKTPPYVHHFDTYGLVQELIRKNAYTSVQSITIMKGVRQMLLDNMQLARDGLVSKSNVENQTYLFRAACSEVRNEIGNARKAEVERLRTERNQLQHEVDILSQRLGQELQGLKDELKGLFDDRKMAVRQEQTSMQTQIQELGYKITIALNSESRSQVEGLRWILTRRAAITLGASAFMLFIGLRYASYHTHQLQQEEKERRDRETAMHRGSPLEDLAQGLAKGVEHKTDEERVNGGEVLASEGISVG